MLIYWRDYDGFFHYSGYECDKEDASDASVMAELNKVDIAQAWGA